MYEYGLVEERSEESYRVRVRFPARDDLVSDWLGVLVPCASGHAAYGLPAVGEQVAVLVGEHESDGVVLGALYSAATPPPGGIADKRGTRYSDGTVIEYDPGAHVLHIEIAEGGEVRLSGSAIRLGELNADVGVARLGDSIEITVQAESFESSNGGMSPLIPVVIGGTITSASSVVKAPADPAP